LGSPNGASGGKKEKRKKEGKKEGKTIELPQLSEVTILQ
jgi:hypothetical protein